MKTLTLNKNRGWRGLAEAVVKNEDGKTVNKMIFSFSNNMWCDLINHHKIVIQDEKYYYVVHFTDFIRGMLPRPDQQRSVLIKDFTANIDEVNKYEKASWNNSTGEDWACLCHFIKNNNNHTQSDWNCIGVRVMPEI